MVLRTDRAPVCNNVSTSTPHNTSVAVKLNCSDPDGENVVYEKLRATRHANPGRRSGRHQ